MAGTHSHTSGQLMTEPVVILNGGDSAQRLLSLQTGKATDPVRAGHRLPLPDAPSLVSLQVPK